MYDASHAMYGACAREGSGRTQKPQACNEGMRRLQAEPRLGHPDFMSGVGASPLDIGHSTAYGEK